MCVITILEEWYHFKIVLSDDNVKSPLCKKKTTKSKITFYDDKVTSPHCKEESCVNNHTV